MLRASEKDPEGGDKNGGGKGLGALFANSAIPVSNLKGVLLDRREEVWAFCEIGATSGRDVWRFWTRHRLG